MLQLKRNFIPKGLIPLEQLFDKNDIPAKPTVKLEPTNTCQYNLGSEENPQTINLSRLLPQDQVQKYLDLFQEYKDAFAWNYDELKTYDTSITQHKIPLKEKAVPFAQKLRQFNPILLPVIEKEIRKLLNAKIIIPIRYSEWIANLVPVRNKSGEIKLCIDFRNLNRWSLKDNYPLLKMDHIL